MHENSDSAGREWDGLAAAHRNLKNAATLTAF